jgi:hypothetical protein
MASAVPTTDGPIAVSTRTQVCRILTALQSVEKGDCGVAKSAKYALHDAA